MKHQNGNGTTLWSKVVGIAALITVCISIGGSLGYLLWWQFTLSSDLRYQTLRYGEIEKRMGDDKGDLDKRITENNNAVRTLQLTVRAQERDLNEIETQFCGNDIVRNKNQAEVQRILALLWTKSYGTTYPTDNAYYPTICNRQANK